MKNGDVGGQPDRFYVTADSALSIAGDFRDFGADMTQLRKRLQGGQPASGSTTRFPEYGRDFRRRLGIESEQAMELFHQTVSMKSVGNLTEFVREHMLEPFNAAKATRDIVAHFEDLTSAHEAVLARPGAARRAHPAARGLRRARPAGRRDRRADRPARGAAVLLRRSQGSASRRVARPVWIRNGSGLLLHRKRLDERLAGLRERETRLQRRPRRPRRQPARRHRTPAQGDRPGA